MLVTLLALLCLANGDCVERTVTDQATMMQCTGAFAAQTLPTWMEENGYTARGYRLAKWKCIIGGKRTGI